MISPIECNWLKRIPEMPEPNLMAKHNITMTLSRKLKLISDVLSDIRFGKKFEKVLEAMERCPDDQFYKLDIVAQPDLQLTLPWLSRLLSLTLSQMGLGGRAAD